MMVDASKREMSIETFLENEATNSGFHGPIGVIGICAQDGHGDLAVARAAANAGVPMVHRRSPSTQSRPSYEFGDVPGFFQLYTPNDRGIGESLSIEQSPLDSKGSWSRLILDSRLATTDLARSNFPQLRGHCLANYFTDPYSALGLAKPPEKIRRRLFSCGPTFSDVP